MTSPKRPFRSQESYEAEVISRNMIAPFLREHGVEVLEDIRRPVGKSESQVVNGCRARRDYLGLLDVHHVLG